MSVCLVATARVYDEYAISRRFTTQDTAIHAVQGNIDLIVSKTEIEQLKNGNKTIYSWLSNIDISLSSITLAVSNSVYKDINGVLTAVTQSRSSIEIHADQILQKVSKDSVISSINQTAEAIKIDANKIALTGNGVIDILNTGTTTIKASRINLSGLVTANENFKILNDGSMLAVNGVFRGDTHINGGGLYLNYDPQFGDATIYMTAQDKSQAFYSTSGVSIGVNTDKRIRIDTITGISIFAYGNQTSIGAVNSSIGGYLEVNGSFNAKNVTTLDGLVMMNSQVTIKGYTTVENTISSTGIYCKGALTATGSKNRAVNTRNFGVVLQNAYETCEPLFGDVGHCKINSDGKATVFIDPVFGETVSTEYGYYIFITKYAHGDIWVGEKKPSYFIVFGSEGMEFDWEIKAHQKEYERTRLEKFNLEELSHN